MLDIMSRYGSKDAFLLIHQVSGPVKVFRDGKLQTGTTLDAPKA